MSYGGIPTINYFLFPKHEFLIFIYLPSFFPSSKHTAKVDYGRNHRICFFSTDMHLFTFYVYFLPHSSTILPMQLLYYIWFRFHPACIDMSAEEAERLDHFFCESCSPEGQKKLENSHTVSRQLDTKVHFLSTR